MEAEIVVNGQRLSEAQAMTLRVALTNFHEEMADPIALGDDAHGRAMVIAYRRRATDILSIATPQVAAD